MDVYRFVSVTEHGTTEVSYPVEKLRKSHYHKAANGRESVTLYFEGEADSKVLNGDDAASWRKVEKAYIANRAAAEDSKDRAEQAIARALENKAKVELARQEEQRIAKENLEKVEEIRKNQAEAEQALKDERARQVAEKVSRARKQAILAQKTLSVKAANEKVEEAKEERKEAVAEFTEAKEKTAKKKRKKRKKKA